MARCAEPPRAASRRTALQVLVGDQTVLVGDAQRIEKAAIIGALMREVIRHEQTRRDHLRHVPSATR